MHEIQLGRHSFKNLKTIKKWNTCHNIFYANEFDYGVTWSSSYYANSKDFIYCEYPSINIALKHTILNLELLTLYIYNYLHQSVLPKGRPFTANSGTKAALLLKGRSSTANSRTQAAVLLGWRGAVASSCFPHPTSSLASIKTLKDLKRSQRHQRGGEESGFG